MPERLASAVATRRENEVIVSAAFAQQLHNCWDKRHAMRATVFLLSLHSLRRDCPYCAVDLFPSSQPQFIGARPGQDQDRERPGLYRTVRNKLSHEARNVGYFHRGMVQ